jgi:hypothetical protein
MSKRQQISERGAALAKEIEEKTVDYEDGKIGAKAFGLFIDDAADRKRSLQTELANYQKACAFRAGNDPTSTPLPGATNKGMGMRSTPDSPMHMTDPQLKSLWGAMRNRVPFQVEIGAKGLESGFAHDVETKAAVTESALNQNLPAVIAPNKAMGLPYEPSRISGYLPAATMLGPSAAYLTHVSNASEATGVPEAGDKPDISPLIQETIIYPQKLAGLVSVSLEASMDYADFSNWLPIELSRSVINQESNYLLNAGTANGPADAVFTGLLAASGTLARVVDAANGETPLDAVNRAFVDLRTGPAFAEADLVILNPATWAALRREKDSTGRYILSLLDGPRSVSFDGSPNLTTVPTTEAEKWGVPQQGVTSGYESLWGVPVVETTQLAPGTAVVLSVRAGAAVFWQRLGMILFFNPYSDTAWRKNLFSWRCEERISLSIPRPSAVNILTGLPTG